jgi:hypothetical protein
VSVSVIVSVMTPPLGLAGAPPRPPLPDIAASWAWVAASGISGTGAGVAAGAGAGDSVDTTRYCFDVAFSCTLRFKSH